MKKLLILTAVGAILAAPAMAVQKCVKLTVSSTCAAPGYSQAYKYIDWSATCTTNGNEIPIQGIGVCSTSVPTDYESDSEASELVVADTIASGSSDDDTTRLGCWCKMVSPAVSKWVFLLNYTNNEYEDCAPYCALACGARMKGNNTKFKAALFSNLSD